jgi:hypothetical protein
VHARSGCEPSATSARAPAPLAVFIATHPAQLAHEPAVATSTTPPAGPDAGTAAARGCVRCVP